MDKSTGNNNTARTKTDDKTDVWIPMDDKLLDDDIKNENLNDSKLSKNSKSLDNIKEDKIQIDKSTNSDNTKKSSSSECLTKNDNQSLNSSQSSFVQLNTKNIEKTDKTKEISSKPTSLASKWFGRKSEDKQQKDKLLNNKNFSKKKQAPQITSVIYKRKPNLPEIPIKSTKLAKVKNDQKQTVCIPDSDETDDEAIYSEINETQLVLEEMRRSLNFHSTECKIIEKMMVTPPINLQATFSGKS